jgi:phosphatidylglycerol:prolipoprotein diacylglycerol transferase
MHPEIVNIGPIVVTSYGLALALSFFRGLILVQHRSRRAGINRDFVLNLAFFVMLSGVLGARLFYSFYHWSDFSNNLLDIFNPFGSSEGFGIAGLNVYGGMVTAIAVALIYCRIKRESIPAVFDLFAPALGLGIFITRIGCFLNGCCFGLECHLPWAVRFPEGSIPYSYLGDVLVHPTQLYSSLYGLLLFVLLSYVEKKKRFLGLTFSIFLIVEAFFRYLIENVRYYEDQMETVLLGVTFTYNHIVAILLFILGWVLLFVFRKLNLQPGRLIQEIE